MWQLGIKVADEIKFASQLTLKQGDYFGLSRPNVIKCPSEWKRVGRQVRVMWWEKGGGGVPARECRWPPDLGRAGKQTLL